MSALYSTLSNTNFQTRRRFPHFGWSLFAELCKLCRWVVTTSSSCTSIYTNENLRLLHVCVDFKVFLRILCLSKERLSSHVLSYWSVCNLWTSVEYIHCHPSNFAEIQLLRVLDFCLAQWTLVTLIKRTWINFQLLILLYYWFAVSFVV